MNKLCRLGWILAMCTPALGMMAQEKGVVFRQLPYAQALEKARAEKKQVFIDFYTEWCGPCKRMGKEVFPQKSVGDYFNCAFVSLKMDAEQGEGKELARQYKIRAYPTFVVLSADGTEVYRTAGFRPAEEFVEKIRKGVDPQWSPAGLTHRYEKRRTFVRSGQRLCVDADGKWAIESR